MADISIPSEIADRLRQVAQNEHRTIEAVVEEILNRYLQQEAQQSNTPLGSFAEMARVASENPIETNSTDTSSRSREILENEYAQYLLKRLKGDEGNE